LDFQGDIGDFHELFQQLQTAYHEVDAVFAASGLSRMEIPTSDVHVREGANGKFIEIFANKLLPFSQPDATSRSVCERRRLASSAGTSNAGLYEKAAKQRTLMLTTFISVAQNLDQPYTIIEDFTKEMFSNNSRADVKAIQIVQRIVNSDRDMILFVSSVTPIEIKHKPIDGLVYHAREYALTKRFSDSTPEHDISLLQLYVRISFDYDPGVVYDSRHVRSVAQFVIGNVGGSLRCYQERIENALIDQALHSRHDKKRHTSSCDAYE
ncbi:M96 mating-specific protein family, partial [Phytophthora palmivora]